MEVQRVTDWVSVDNMGLVYLFKILSVLEGRGGVMGRLLDTEVPVIGVPLGTVDVKVADFPPFAQGLVCVADTAEGPECKDTACDEEASGTRGGGEEVACTGDI